jgi:hypothetical protein
MKGLRFYLVVLVVIFICPLLIVGCAAAEIGGIDELDNQEYHFDKTADDYTEEIYKLFEMLDEEQSDHESIQGLLVRNILLREGKILGIVITRAEVDAEVETIINNHFEGSEEVFLNTLKTYDITLEAFLDDAHLDLLIRKLVQVNNENVDELFANLLGKAQQEYLQAGGKTSIELGDKSIETIVPEVELPAAVQIFSATQESISLGEGEFEVSVYMVAVEDSVDGNKPVEMNSASEHIIFVEFKLSTGDRIAFETLRPLLEDGSGKTSEAVAVISGGMVRVLATLQMTNETTDYSPENEHITWAYVSSRNAKELYLVFQDDVKIDLTPLLKDID